MELLPLSFRDRGFLYEQVERQGEVALYSQTNHSGIVRYEVIRIRIQPEHTWPTGVTTPEKEAYPGSTSWGRLGWTFFLMADARVKLLALQGQPDEEADVLAQPVQMTPPGGP